jgi:MFS family permease
MYVLGTGFFLLMVLAFSGSTSYALSVALLFVAGFGMAAYTSMQVTLMVAGSVPEMRGRVMGAVSLSLGGNPIGALNVGILAGALGAPIATAIMGVEGLIVLALIALRYPALRRPFVLHDEAAQSVTPATPSGGEVRVGRSRDR